ncbi:hypothetical protein EI94DRAFT_462009 [Lactarius quietus]|nr:hypothetical protein EI94DRAFT_462009 [Lactarius quietus]
MPVNDENLPSKLSAYYFPFQILLKAGHDDGELLMLCVRVSPKSHVMRRQKRSFRPEHCSLRRSNIQQRPTYPFDDDGGNSAGICHLFYDILVCVLGCLTTAPRSHDNTAFSISNRSIQRHGTRAEHISLKPLHDLQIQSALSTRANPASMKFSMLPSIHSSLRADTSLAAFGLSNARCCISSESNSLWSATLLTYAQSSMIDRGDASHHDMTRFSVRSCAAHTPPPPEL